MLTAQNVINTSKLTEIIKNLTENMKSLTEITTVLHRDLGTLFDELAAAKTKLADMRKEQANDRALIETLFRHLGLGQPHSDRSTDEVPRNNPHDISTSEGTSANGVGAGGARDVPGPSATTNDLDGGGAVGGNFDATNGETHTDGLL